MNKFIKIYEDGNVPSFSFSDLEFLQNDKTLDDQERFKFKVYYLKAKKAIENGADPQRICVFIKPESGELSLTIGKYLIVNGAYDIELSHDEMIEMAFNHDIPNELQKHYQQVLIDAAKKEKDWNCGWHRFIFCLNPVTSRVRIWFD